MKKLICKKCDTLFGKFENDNLILHNTKPLSKIETNTKTGESNIKCHYCNSWNAITKEGIVSTNYKRTAQEILN